MASTIVSSLYDILRLVGLGPKPDDKDVEIAVLRHQLAVCTARFPTLATHQPIAWCWPRWPGCWLVRQVNGPHGVKREAAHVDQGLPADPLPQEDGVVIGSGIDRSLSRQFSTLTASSRVRRSRGTGSMSTPMTPGAAADATCPRAGGRLTPSPGASAMVGAVRTTG